jgi:hypothetical protein
MKELKYWAISAAVILGLAAITILFDGCATTGTIAPELIEQSASVDTAISQLQGQQAESAQAAQAVSDTAENIQQTAAKINDPELTTQVNRLNEQTKKLLDSQNAERNETATMQTAYTTVKTKAGTTIVDNSKQINKLTAQLAVYKKWVWRLGITLAVLVLLIILYIVLKITGRLSF